MLPAIDELQISLRQQLTRREAQEVTIQADDLIAITNQANNKFSDQKVETSYQGLEDLYQRIEKAITAEQILTIRYNNPNKFPTLRQIEPIYIEQHGEYFYVLSLLLCKKRTAVVPIRSHTNNR